MSDPKQPPAEGTESDSTLMLNVQDAAPELGANDATLLGVKLPDIPEAAAPAPEATAAFDAATGPKPSARARPPTGSQRLATGARPAVTSPAPAEDPALAGETLMINPDAVLAAGAARVAGEEANATVLFSAREGPAVQAEQTVNDAPSKPERPKSGARRAPREEAPIGADDPPAAAPEVTNLTPGSRTANGVQLVTAGFLLLVALTVTAAFFVSRTKKPSDTELRLLYPFGDGRTLPNGRTAPPSRAIEFELQSSDDCDGARCLTYHVTGDHSFSYLMVVRPAERGWSLVSSRPAEH